MATLATPAEKKGQQVPEDKSERKPRPRVDEKFKIFCGTANEALADEVCHFLGLTGASRKSRAFRMASVTCRSRRTCAAPTCS